MREYTKIYITKKAEFSARLGHPWVFADEIIRIEGNYIDGDLVDVMCSAAGISAVHPGTGKTITVVNLLSQDGIRMMLNKAVTNFSGFAPLGMVLVAVIGSGAAEKSGFLAVLMHKVLASAPPAVVTFAILFVGINGNIAGDSAFVIMPPLSAIVFLSMDYLS